jgi:hypothetical protein
MNEGNPPTGSTAPENPGATGPQEEHLPTTRLPPVSLPPVGRSARPAASSALRVSAAVKDAKLTRQSIGFVCAGLGLVLTLAGLAMGLSVGFGGATTDASVAAAVDVALVVTRGVVVLGMLAFGCGLIFFASRLLLGRDFPGVG